MSKRSRKNEEGMALLVATLFVAIALITVAAVTNRVVNQKRQVDHYINFENCMYGVECGSGTSKMLIESGRPGNVGVAADYDVAEQGVPSFDSGAVTPLEVPEMPGVEYFSVDQNWMGDGVDTNGDGTVDGPDENWYHSIFAYARTQGAVRGVEVVVRGDDVSCWRNAIFAGAGQAGGAIRGNVSVHGSVHVLANHIPEGGESIVVMDLMGASLIHNNYGEGAGPGPALSENMGLRVPPQKLVTVNGESDQRTLDAELRVKRGLVSLNSSSEIGQTDTAGNGVKDLMDGTYNSHGWTGQRTVDDGDRGDPTVVYSDNGWDEVYDLGDKVPFPELTDDWRWPPSVACSDIDAYMNPIPGGTEIAPDGNNYSHIDFFRDELSDGVYNGNITINTNANYYLNLTRGGVPADRVTPDPATCRKGDDYIYFNAATNVLEMNGQIMINGNLTFGGKGNDGTINYTGRAAFLTQGDVAIDVKMLPCNSGDPNNYVRSFPENNCLGVMATNNIYLGSGNGAAQLDLCGAFYAANQVQSFKQTRVMGTFVANYFDMGNQVPDIYEVPNLADWLPLGMVGAFPIVALSPVSWREIQPPTGE